MSAERPTLLEVCYAKRGMVGAARVLADIGSWAFVMQLAGDEWPRGDARGVLTARVALYRDAFGYSERTAWRRLQAFRECFPGEVDPTRMCDVLKIHAEDKKAARDSMAIGRLVLP